MANGQQAWQLGLSYDEAPSDVRRCLVLLGNWATRLPDRRGERPPRVSGERKNGAAAVGRITDQHGFGCGDFYALSAVGARVSALAPAAFHVPHIRSIKARDSDLRSASFRSVSNWVIRPEMMSASSNT